MQIKMNTYVKGQVLLVKTKDTHLRGCFHSMSDDCSVLTLTDVKWLPMELPVDGLFHVSQSEILSIRLLEPGTNVASSKENKLDSNFKLMRHVPPPAHPGRDVGKVKECDVVPNYNPYLHTGNPSWSRTLKKLDETVTKLCVVAEKFIYVENAETFEMMVESLQEESILALEFEGIAFGFWKKSGLINLATWHKTFLLDLKILDTVLFVKEMKKILEDENVVKIIHNCRLISYHLLQDYNIILKNVFDTQVADICTMINHYEELPLFTRSLPDCLSFYLNLPEVLIHRPYVRDGYIEVDLSSWMKRPLHLGLQHEAVKNGKFLLLLHDRLKGLDNDAFRLGCNIYLNVVRNMEKTCTDEHVPEMYMVPPEMHSVKHKILGNFS